MKYSLSQWTKEEQKVAPFAGAWIEMCRVVPLVWLVLVVAPFAGAWIEMLQWMRWKWGGMSLPSRERGLK